MMRKLIKIFFSIALAILLTPSQDISAQIIELNAFTGWQFGGTAHLYDADFKIQDAQNYGGKLAMAVSSTTYVEISYMRADTEGSYIPFYGIGDRIDGIELSSNYLQIGGLQEVDLDRVHPYGTFGLGVVWWAPKTSQLNSKVQFSPILGAGLKIWLTEVIGIRLQGTLMLPMIYNGVGIGCGIGTGGSGCGGSVYTRITPVQGEFSGGLIIRLSPNKG